jgi:hypothetical protein
MKSIQLSTIKKKIGAERFTIIREVIFKSSIDRPSRGMTLQRDRIVNAIKDPETKKNLESLTSNVDWFVVDVV